MNLGKKKNYFINIEQNTTKGYDFLDFDFNI